MSEVSKTPHNGQNTGGGQSEHDIRSIRREESIQAGKSADIAHDSKKSGALRELIVYVICGGLTTVVSVCSAALFLESASLSFGR